MISLSVSHQSSQHSRHLCGCVQLFIIIIIILLITRKHSLRHGQRDSPATWRIRLK